MSSESSNVPAFKSRVFLWDADMHPTAIRGRWPAARFEGIASGPGFLTQGIGLPPFAFGPRVWGILIDTGEPQRGMAVPIARRDGAEAAAMLVGDPYEVGSLAVVLAEARYWELPRDYRDAIEAVIAGS